jgi:hypothetical protein
LDDAAALTAAEQMVQQLVNLARSSSDNGNGNSSGDGDAAAAAAAKEKDGSEAAAGSAMEVDVPPQQQQQQQEPAVGSKEHQLLLGRRLLQVRHTGCISLCETSLAACMKFFALTSGEMALGRVWVCHMSCSVCLDAWKPHRPPGSTPSVFLEYSL